MKTSTFPMVAACLSPLFAAGCAGHGEVHVAPDESKPHISWEIRSGRNEGDEEFICGSSEPPQCVLPASTQETPQLAALHLLGHSAEQATSYLGFMRASCLEGDTERKLGEINVTLEPGNRPVGKTVIGRVTSQPGTYALTISVDATQPGSNAPQHISESVRVVVK